MDEQEKNDEQIVDLIQSGKVELFGILINRYEKKMLRYAGKMLDDSGDKQDVVQEIFIKTYINIQSFDTKRKFSSWLYRIAHNEIVNVFRKNKRLRFLPIFDLDTFFPQSAKNNFSDVYLEAEKKEMQKIIEFGLNQLDGKYKESIILYYLEEFSYKEIADILKIPIATVGVRIKRAKQMLKLIFEKKGYKND